MSNETPEKTSIESKHSKPEMDKADKDVFDFLNQLGTGESSEVKFVQKEVKKEDEWDMMFNINTSPQSKPFNDLFVAKPPTNEPPKSSPKLIAPPPRTGGNKQQTTNFEGINWPGAGAASDLNSINWGSSTGFSGLPHTSTGISNMNVFDDPFAALEAGNKPNDPASIYNAPSKPKEVKKELSSAAMDDLFKDYI